MLRIVIATVIVSQLASSDVLDCVCGREGGRTRIVNGTPVGQGKFPWIVALVYKGPNGTWWQFCGGTLINDRWILTAAHCVADTRPSYIYIAKGQVNIQNVNSGNIMRVDRIWSHPLYTGGADLYHNDIALLRLSNPVTFTQDFSPICLPSADMRYFDNLFNIGWGSTSVDGETSNQLLYIETQQRHDCESMYQSMKFWSKQICTYAYGNGLCQGDSGGPLCTRKNGYVTQVGVNSWVVTGTCGLHPDVTTRVSDYLSEIQLTTAGSNWCRNPNSDH